VNIHEFLDYVSPYNPIKQGNEWRICCPVHADTDPSLYIAGGNNGEVLLCCRSNGCNNADIVRALGLQMSDLYPSKPSGSSLGSLAPAKPKPPATSESTANPNTPKYTDVPPWDKPIVATYDYVDESGKLVYQVVRHPNKPNGDKDFSQRRKHVTAGSASWAWNLKGISPIIYRIPDVINAVKNNQPVFIVEGEKDVHSLEAWGFTATTNSSGSKAKWPASASQVLKGADVVILPDNDNPGKTHAEKVAFALKDAAARIRILELPDLPPKGDISDWIAAGHSIQEFNGLITACPTWNPNADTPIPEIARGFPFTDLGNAERLIATYKNILRYNVDTGYWLIWNKKQWVRDQTGVIHRLARTVVRSLYDLLKDAKTIEERDALYAHIKRSESAPRLSAMVDLARYCEGIPVRSSELDCDAWLLNCQNGTVNLRDGTLQPHSQSDLITKMAPVDFDKNATCPRWEQFLVEVFQENLELVEFVQRMTGYSMTGVTREQCFFILHGKGSNGKGIFVDTIRDVLGDYAKDTPVTTFLERKSENTSDLALLSDARVVTASEGDETTSFNESLLKRMSGEDTITCRHMYKEFFTYTPKFKILFATNEIPKIRSQNYAMKRRMKLIPFRQRFYYPHEQMYPVRDEQLKDKLQVELSGIFMWMIRGCLKWQDSGLGMPKTMQQEVDKIFESMDPLLDFLESECVIHPGAQVEAGILWQAYVDWCAREERLPAFKQTQWFTHNLTARDGIEAKRTAKARMLIGIGLVDKKRENDENDANKDFSPKSPDNSIIRKDFENNENPSYLVTNNNQIENNQPVKPWWLNDSNSDGNSDNTSNNASELRQFDDQGREIF
jgi:putative DNA primase/helicase